MTKIQIISDSNKKSKLIKYKIVKKINSEKFKKTNVVIVIGGDGFMLQTLISNNNSNKFFYNEFRELWFFNE